ncbi:TPA: hypothetical protein VDA20_001833 [Streptococcus pyogenes]|uniref:Uncharacterized protein n=1 Tax=Streptococcus pyogenes TaxID=1314 RepID=A0A660A4S5_STRPY|nr:hypothetical protein [Streptococcus pyogenes]ERL12502.1 hypothetical protein HMPREF1231_1332 [Streptococcus pyogenes GA06023]ESA45552.1 hypothetical protein HMPREF1232_0834 [Streptococcus pyogenes GA40468]ESU88008.1 hypothetical protein HMPREF1240_0303 [Streptococcus pyogenes GA03455]QBX18822.1 hypothetical protein Javan447_0016 [Streptococcus phage Javan447]QBX28993.1 hypothetical protein Javan476_0042 [Streptococcus phage Javan476]QBX29357.1 hypothetical protein Javan492_0043 [Streptococ
MSEIIVDLKRTGFPVKIGQVELWFDTSQERLIEFFDIETEVNRRLNEYEKQVIEANLDNEIEDKGVTKDVAQSALDLEAKYLEINYDLLFGEGTFAQLYAEYPDKEALENTLEIVCREIEVKLKELAIEREKIVKQKTKKYKKE